MSDTKNNNIDWAGWGTAGSAVGAYFDGVLSGIAQHGSSGLESASRIVGRMSAMIDVSIFVGPALVGAAIDGRLNEEFIAQGTSFVGSVAGMRIGFRSGAFLGARLGSVTFGPEVTPAASIIGGVAGAAGGSFVGAEKTQSMLDGIARALGEALAGIVRGPNFSPEGFAVSSARIAGSYPGDRPRRAQGRYFAARQRPCPRL